MTMQRRRILRDVLGLMVLGVAQRALAVAEAYPVRPIKVIVPYAPGSIVDVHARKLAAPLAEGFGQPIIVENRPGASGTLGVGVGVTAKPDGYTVTIGSSSNLAVSPAFGLKLSFDPVKDVQPVTMHVRAGLVLVAHPSLGVKSVTELIALAKRRPGQITHASSGPTGIGRLASEVFQHETGVRFLLINVSYKTPVALAVLANEVSLAFDFAITTASHVNAGKMRALVVTGSKRVASLPEVPTVLEAGLPGTEIYGWAGFIVPSGTPAPIVQRLHKEILIVLARSDIRAMFDSEGSEVVGSSPDEFRAYIAAEQAKFARIVKGSGIEAEKE
jgi:tripartite-type tricarboxylate transporter receptor subunit TctC